MTDTRQTAKIRPLYWPGTACSPETRQLEHEGTIHEHYTSDRAAAEALLRWLQVDPVLQPRYLCITGPGGLVRGVDGLWLGEVIHDETAPLELRKPAYAECRGADDPCCGQCRLSMHGCNGARSRAEMSSVMAR